MCINQDTKFEVCSITNSKNMIGARFLKVAQLLLMHQSDALHHGKQQNFKTVT